MTSPTPSPASPLPKKPPQVDLDQTRERLTKLGLGHAAERLAEDGIDIMVIACPFLNRVDGAWFADKLKGVKLLMTVDNHYVNSGFGDQLLAALAREGATLPPSVISLGLTDIPASGQPGEVLRHHGLDELVEEGRQIWSERAHIGDLAAIKGRSRVTEAEALTDRAGLGSFRVLEWSR